MRIPFEIFALKTYFHDSNSLVRFFSFWFIFKTFSNVFSIYFTWFFFIFFQSLCRTPVRNWGWKIALPNVLSCMLYVMVYFRRITLKINLFRCIQYQMTRIIKWSFTNDSIQFDLHWFNVLISECLTLRFVNVTKRLKFAFNIKIKSQRLFFFI